MHILSCHFFKVLPSLAIFRLHTWRANFEVLTSINLSASPHTKLGRFAKAQIVIPVTFVFDYRYICHLLNEAFHFAEAALPVEIESVMNIVRSEITTVVDDQSSTRQEVNEMTVRLAEEQDGRENTE